MQNSHQRIAYKRQKPTIIELNFETIRKTAKNSTAKLQPINLSETSGDTATKSGRLFTKFLMFLPSSQPDFLSVMTG